MRKRLFFIAGRTLQGQSVGLILLLGSLGCFLILGGLAELRGMIKEGREASVNFCESEEPGEIPAEIREICNEKENAHHSPGIRFSRFYEEGGRIPTGEREEPVKLWYVERNYLQGADLVTGMLFPEESVMPYLVVNRAFAQRCPDWNMLYRIRIGEAYQDVRMTGMVEDGIKEPVVYLNIRHCQQKETGLWLVRLDHTPWDEGRKASMLSRLEAGGGILLGTLMAWLFHEENDRNHHEGCREYMLLRDGNLRVFRKIQIYREIWMLVGMLLLGGAGYLIGWIFA